MFAIWIPIVYQGMKAEARGACKTGKYSIYMNYVVTLLRQSIQGYHWRIYNLPESLSSIYTLHFRSPPHKSRQRKENGISTIANPVSFATMFFRV